MDLDTQAKRAAAKPAPAPRRARPKRKATSRMAASPPKRTMPTRSSARLRGVTAADSDAASGIKAESPEAGLRDQRLAPVGDVDLRALGGGELHAAQLAALQRSLERAALVKGDDMAAEVKGAPLSADEKELSAILSGMQLRSGDKVTPKRVYTMAFHPGNENLLFMGDTDGVIGVWQPDAPPVTEDDEEETQDADPEALPTGASYTLPGGHGRSSLTCLRFDPIASDTLYSSSYDGSIRALSLADQVSRPVWQTDGNTLFSSFDILAPTTHVSAFASTPHPAVDERQIWLADHKGGLLHLDLREQKSTGRARRWQVSDKKVGSLSVNPANPAVVATASLDQHVRLFDVRKLATLDEMDAPTRLTANGLEELQETRSKSELGSFKTKYAFISVDFSPHGDHLAGVSYDDWISLWHFAKPAALTVKQEKRKWWEKPSAKAEASVTNPLTDPHRFAHNNQTGRWVTSLRALWHCNVDLPAHFCVRASAPIM